MENTFDSQNSLNSNNSLNFLKEIGNTINELVNLFDRTIDTISSYGVGVGQKVKNLGIKFLKSMGFIDQELNQITYIKNHLRDIEKAIQNNDPIVNGNAGKLFFGLQTMWDNIVERINGNNSFYNNLGFAVEEIGVMTKNIQEKIIIN